MRAGSRGRGRVRVEVRLKVTFRGMERKNVDFPARCPDDDIPGSRASATPACQDRLPLLTVRAQDSHSLLGRAVCHKTAPRAHSYCGKAACEALDAVVVLTVRVSARSGMRARVPRCSELGF